MNGFHPKLFRLAGVGRDELLTDAGRLPAFVERLKSIGNLRRSTQTTNGQADLIDSPAKVKKRQDAIRMRVGRVDERTTARRQRTNARLRELFPEIRHRLK